jgi:hypothetical protein
MRGNIRLALIGVSSLLLFSLYLLETHLQDLCNQYRAGAYAIAWLDRNATTTPIPGINHGDKVIVMAKLEEEPTDWVAQELPEYVLPSIPIPTPVQGTRPTIQFKSPSNKSQLATRNLRRQPLPLNPLKPQYPNNPLQQGPRINGLLHLHNRELLEPP